MNKVYLVANNEISKVAENIPQEKFLHLQKLYGVIGKGKHEEFVNLLKEIFPSFNSLNDIQAVALAESCTHCGKLTSLADWSWYSNGSDMDKIWGIVFAFDHSLQSTDLWHSGTYLNPAKHNGLEYADICDSCFENYSDEELDINFDNYDSE